MSGFTVDVDRAVLVVIDLQDRLMAAMPLRQEVIAAALRLIKGCSVLGVPILVTEQYPRGLGPTVEDLISHLPKGVEKLDFDCCGERSFLDSLKATGRNQVLVCGAEAHVCVLQTCLSLLDKGYDVHLVADAICSRKDSDKDIAMATARQAGVVVSSVETALFQMLKRAGSADFKEISAIVR